MKDIDPANYTRMPPTNVASTLAVALALLTAAPSTLPRPLKAWLLRLKGAAARLQQAWTKSQATSSVDPRLADFAVDRAWGALYWRLVASNMLPMEANPRHAEIAALIELCFPGGLQFLTLPYPQEWAESERRLHIIDQQGLAPALDMVAGPEHLAEIRRAHAEYGAVLGMTHPKPLPEEAVNLVEPLQALRQAIVDYCLRVAAMVEPRDDDAVRAARTALLPFDELRAAIARRNAGGSVPPAAPEPEAASPEPASPSEAETGEAVT